MKKLALILLLGLTVLVLAGCQQQPAPKVEETTDSQTGVGLQESPLEAASQAGTDTGIPDDYDRSSEEGDMIPIEDVPRDASGVALSAGATPMPLDPVDMPSPTKRPDLTFTFATYTAANLGLTFESVAGYLVDDKDPNVYVLTEPIEQQKDNYSVVFTLSLSAVTNAYTLNSLRTDLRAFAAELGKVNYQEWRVSDTAQRTLLGKQGYYITYRGVQYDGTIVRGRVHMALLDNNRVLSLHYTGPGEYNTDYSDNVFTRIRSTLKTL